MLQETIQTAGMMMDDDKIPCEPDDDTPGGVDGGWTGFCGVLSRGRLQREAWPCRPPAAREGCKVASSGGGRGGAQQRNCPISKFIMEKKLN